MALNIKNPEVERLVADIAALTGESKTEAIRRALEERKVRLAYRLTKEGRAAKLKRFLEQELWPAVPADQTGRRLTREEEEVILGLGDHGV